jgi:short-subunit dehydrogenase
MSKNEYVVICGAGPNLGAALAHEYAANGLDVVLLSRNGGRAASLAEQVRRGLTERAGAVEGMEGDVGSGSITQAARILTHRRGAPEVVVFNAVAFVPGSPSDTTSESLLSQLNVSAAGLLRTAQAFLPGMAARGSGAFLVTGGGTATRPWLAATGLGVQKAAVANLAKAIAAEYRNSGVRVSLITVPGTIAEAAPFPPAYVAAAFRTIGSDPAAPVESVLEAQPAPR